MVRIVNGPDYTARLDHLTDEETDNQRDLTHSLMGLLYIQFIGSKEPEVVIKRTYDRLDKVVNRNFHLPKNSSEEARVYYDAARIGLLHSLAYSLLTEQRKYIDHPNLHYSNFRPLSQSELEEMLFDSNRRSKTITREQEVLVFTSLNFYKKPFVELAKRLLESGLEQGHKLIVKEMYEAYKKTIAFRSTIIEANMPLAKAMAARSTVPIRFDEKLDIGIESLFRTVDFFDPSKTFKFSTYFRGAFIKVLARDYKKNSSLRYIDLSTIADHRSKDTSGNDHEDQIGKMLQGLNSPTLNLTIQERLVLRERFLVDEPKTLDQIGEERGLTKEWIRQIQNKAIAKLRKNNGFNSAFLDL